MEKYIDAMIRQNLMQRQAERKKVDEIERRRYGERADLRQNTGHQRNR